MTRSPGEKLYSPALLALAVELADHPYDPQAPLMGEARSRTCGSTVLLSCSADDHGRLDHLGMRVKACAVGQASAALFARHAAGRKGGDIADTLERLELWLGGRVSDRILPGLDLLEPARAYPARHEAILLPWRAALAALSKAHDAS